VRKIAAILLLAILTFNWFGYRLVISYLQNEANRQLESKLDVDEYDAAQLIELKIPLHMPYQSNRSDFERVDGEVEIDGVHYKYVKRKVVDGTLILLCLPNEQKMKIESAKINFLKHIGDFQTSSKKGSSKGDTLTFKNIVADYILDKNNWFAQQFVQRSNIHHTVSYSLPGLLYSRVAERPPDC
jgi:hypothetical protein